MLATTVVIFRKKWSYDTELLPNELVVNTAMLCGTSGGWLQLNYAYGQFQLERRRTNSGKSGAVQLCWRYVVTFPDEGAPQTPPGYSPRPRSPQSPRCLDQCRAFDASNASTHSSFFPISTISIYAKRAKDVLMTVMATLSLGPTVLPTVAFMRRRN